MKKKLIVFKEYYDGALQRKNLILAIPTASGKSLIAYLSILQIIIPLIWYAVFIGIEYRGETPSY